MKFTPEIKKQIAEATGLTYLADNLEKLDATTEGQKVADMLRYYCPTAENLAIVNEQTLPAVKESNPEFVYDEDKSIVPVEKVTLTIKATPADATVKIGNAITTSAEVEKNKPVSYEVSKTGYITKSDTVTLTEDKTIEVTLEEELVPVEKVTLTIVPVPADATVKLNDIEQTSIEVDKGAAVKIEVSKEGYKTQLNEAYKVSKTETLTVTLEAEAPVKPEKPEGVIEPTSTANASCTYVNGSGMLYTGSNNAPTNMQVATDGFIELALGPGIVKKSFYPESTAGKYEFELEDTEASNLRFCVGVPAGSVITDLYDVKMSYSDGSKTVDFNLVKADETGYTWNQVQDPSYIITDSAFATGNVCQNVTSPNSFFDTMIGNFTTIMTATPKFDDGKVVTCQIETVVSNVTLQITDEQSFIQAATVGGTAILANNVELTKPIVVAKALTLNLNGKKVFNTQDIFKNDGTRSWSLISVRNAALTITGDGTLHAKENDCYALDVQENGSLTIEQGTYIGNIHAVYVFAGHADIQGGSFSVQQQYENPAQGYEFVLNCYNANREAGIASINVTGGKFVKFNPADCHAEGEHTNFVNEGYQSTKVSDDPVTYEVIKVNIETAAAQPAKVKRTKK